MTMLKQRVQIANWAFDPDESRHEAVDALAKHKKKRYSADKKYKLVKVCDDPLTFKEVIDD